MSGDSYQDTLFTPDNNPDDPCFEVISSAEINGVLNEKNGYQVEPFAENIDAGKNTTIYQAHSYWTKVPPQGITPYIEHFTEPDDLVLDPFCGSGMTGIAALSADQPRKVILNDLGAAATHIAYNYNTPIEANRVELAVDKLESEVTDFFDWLYSTNCEKCGEEQTIKNTIWSEIRECPHCETQFNLWEPAVIDKKVEERKNGFVRDEFDCPHCETTITKTEPEYKGITPTRIEYQCTQCFGRKYQLKALDDADKQRLDAVSAELEKTDLWYPTDEFPDGYNTRQPIKKGLTSIDKFYVDRTLLALARLWEEIQQFDEPAVREKLEFIFTAIAIRTTRKHAYRPWGGAGNNATLFVPTFHREQNVWVTYSRKSSDIIKALAELDDQFPDNVNDRLRVITGSATDIDYLPDNSVDYVFTDPPFGQNINYSEMNYVWESWLQRRTDIEPEAIVNPKQNKDVSDYEDLMRASFKEVRRVLKDDHWMTLVFNNSKSDVWNALQNALTDAGFVIAQFASLDKQQPTLKQITSEGAVGHDVMVNCLNKHSPTAIEGELSDDELISYIQNTLEGLDKRADERRTRELYSSIIGQALYNNRSVNELDFTSFTQVLGEHFDSEIVEIERPYKDIVVEETFWYLKR